MTLQVHVNLTFVVPQKQNRSKAAAVLISSLTHVAAFVDVFGGRTDGLHMFTCDAFDEKAGWM